MLRVSVMNVQNQRIFLKWMRLGTLFIAFCMALYIGTRYEVLTLPRDGCSPVGRYSPGTRVLVDRRPPFWAVGDCVFVESPDGLVHMVLLGSRNEEGAFWTETDMPDCPGVEAEILGWVKPGELLGRIVMGIGH